MKWLILLAVIGLIFVLISCIRIGGQMVYEEKNLQIRIKIGRIWYQFFPQEKKKKSSSKSSRKRERKGATEKEAEKGSVSIWERKDQILQVLPLICEAAGRLKRKIRIDDLTLDLLWSAPDPAACGIGFGTVNAVTGMIWPLFEQNFNVKSYRVRTGVDFDRGRPELYFKLLVTLTIGQAIALGAGVLIQLAKIQKNHPDSKRETIIKKKEAV